MTIIAKGTELKGSLSVDGNIRIDGTVHGDITATDSVEIGKTGIVISTTIMSKSAIIHGRVEGHLVAPQHVTIGAKATLLGDLQTKSLVIEEGAVFHGTSTMMDGKDSKTVVPDKKDSKTVAPDKTETVSLKKS